MTDLAEKLADLSVADSAPAASAGAAREDATPSTAAPSATAATGDGAGGLERAESAPRAGSDNRKLFVGGLPQGSTEEQIAAVFAPFGVVEEVHLIKPSPQSESKRGCCFVTFATAAEAESAIKGLSGQICEALGSTMPLLVRIADPPRSREEQRSRAAQQHPQQRMPAQVGVLPGWPGGFGFGWPQGQPACAFPLQAGQPQFYLPPGAAAAAAGANAAQYMGLFQPGGYGFGMLPHLSPQHGEWSEHSDADGNKYYYNSQSGVSQWEPPAQWQPQQPQQLPLMYPYAQPLPGYFGQPHTNGSMGGQAAALSSGKRGPKGANLAIFCIPNSYSDHELLEIARPYGNVVYAQVSRHRDTGLSRGYGFVSYESVAESERAVEGIHGMVVQGRSLRVEKVKADDEQQRQTR